MTININKIAMAVRAMGLAAISASALLGGPAHAATPAKAPQFELAKRFALEGADSWDYVAYEPVRHHLFVSRDTHVQVVDTNTGKQVGEIANTLGVHGFAFVEAKKLGFITNGRADTITVINLDTLKTVDTIKSGGPDPDGILFAPQLNRLYVSNGHNQSVSAIDPGTRKVVATMTVGGKPESLAVDSHGHVFVNVEDKNEIVEMDGKTNTVLAHWPLAQCDGPSGLAIDAKTERLFTVCANHHMLVVDARSGRDIATLPIGGHPDAAAFDPALKTAFSSNGADGTLTVVREDDPEHFSVVQNVSTQEGAKSMAFDSQAHRVYLVTSQFGQAPAPTADQPHPRPPIVPGTFNVLVVQHKSAAAN
jgi:YVTN family beta-propeller protein